MIESDKTLESKILNITKNDCNHYVLNAIQVVKSLIHLHAYHFSETDNKSLIERVDKRIDTLLRLYDFICEEGRTENLNLASFILYFISNLNSIMKK